MLRVMNYRPPHNLVLDPSRLAVRTLQSTLYPYQDITRAIGRDRLSRSGQAYDMCVWGGSDVQTCIRADGMLPKVAQIAIRPQQQAMGSAISCNPFHAKDMMVVREGI